MIAAEGQKQLKHTGGVRLVFLPLTNGGYHQFYCDTGEILYFDRLN